MSYLNISVKNLENQLDRQEQYSRRNCILIHGITETQDKNTDDISLHTINEHLELELKNVVGFGLASWENRKADSFLKESFIMASTEKVRDFDPPPSPFLPFPPPKTI